MSKIEAQVIPRNPDQTQETMRLRDGALESAFALGRVFQLLIVVKLVFPIQV